MLRKIAPFTMWIALFFVVIGLVLLGYLPGHASENRTVQFDWEYPSTVSDLASFKVYMGADVFSIPDPKARTIQHTYATIDDAKACFSLAALDAKGNESKKSPEVCLDAAPPAPGVFRSTMVPEKVVSATGTTVSKP